MKHGRRSGSWLSRRWEEYEGISPWSVVLALAFVAASGAVMSWWITHARPAAYVECSAGYAAARSARDTAKVDQIRILQKGAPHPVMCRELRWLEEAQKRDSVSP